MKNVGMSSLLLLAAALALFRVMQQDTDAFMSILTCVLLVQLAGRKGEPIPGAVRYGVAAIFAVVATFAISHISTPLGAFVTSLGAGMPDDDLRNGLVALCFSAIAVELVSAPRFRQHGSQTTPVA